MLHTHQRTVFCRSKSINRVWVREIKYCLGNLHGIRGGCARIKKRKNISKFVIIKHLAVLAKNAFVFSAVFNFGAFQTVVQVKHIPAFVLPELYNLRGCWTPRAFQKKCSTAFDVALVEFHKTFRWLKLPQLMSSRVRDIDTN